MGMFALLQFRGKFSEIHWSFFWLKNYCSFEANFCEDFYVWSKCNSFYFFWSLSKSFNRVVRTSLHVFKVTFWRNMFFWGQMIKSDFVEVFGLFPKNFRTLTKKVFGRVVKKNFYVFKLTFLWQKHVFLKKIKFVSILALWAKIFYFLKENLQSTLAKLHSKCSE